MAFVPSNCFSKIPPIVSLLLRTLDSAWVIPTLGQAGNRGDDFLIVKGRDYSQVGGGH
jgi:hypothetical protein